MSSFRQVLRNPQFISFWLGQVISQFGDRINQMALIALVYSRRGTAPIELAIVMAFTIVPSFLISPLAGVLVDRWNRKHTMVAADIIRAVLVVSIPLFCMHGTSMVPIYVLVFLVFSTSCFFLPSKFSVIPELVAPELLLIANSLINTTMIIAVVLGVALGGTLIEQVGPKTGFYIDAMTYAVSALLIGIIRIRAPQRQAVLRPPATGIRVAIRQVWREFIAGVQYMRQHPYVQFVFMTIYLLMAAAGALYIAGIVFIQSIFDSVTRDIGFLAVFIGAGFFLGALGYGRFGHRISRLRMLYLGMLLSGLVVGMFALVLAWYPYIGVAAGLAVVIGITVGPIFISGNTLILEAIPADMRGRVFSFLGIIMNLGFLVAMFLASRLAEFYLPRQVIIGVGLCLSGYGVVGLVHTAKACGEKTGPA